MKPVRSAVVGLLIGAVLGAAAAHVSQRCSETFRQKEVARRFSEQHWFNATNYFHATRRIPIPPDMDLGTDTWRRLTFWKDFARHYSSLSTNGLPLIDSDDPRAWRLAHHPGVGGYVMPILDDPNWMECREAYPAYCLAYDAMLMARKGLSYDELCRWVKSNWTNYSEWSTFQYDRFETARRQRSLNKTPEAAQ